MYKMIWFLITDFAKNSNKLKHKEQKNIKQRIYNDLGKLNKKFM